VGKGLCDKGIRVLAPTGVDTTVGNLVVTVLLVLLAVALVLLECLHRRLLAEQAIARLDVVPPGLPPLTWWRFEEEVAKGLAAIEAFLHRPS
jgi:hypothetical protein